MAAAEQHRGCGSFSSVHRPEKASAASLSEASDVSYLFEPHLAIGATGYGRPSAGKSGARCGHEVAFMVVTGGEIGGNKLEGQLVGVALQPPGSST
jgi:hypothetical protein